MPNNRAYFLGQMLQSIREKRKALTAAADPSNAAADSLAVSGERVAQGVAGAVDSTRLMLAGRIKPLAPPDPSAALDDSVAAAALRGNSGRTRALLDAKNPPKPKEPLRPSQALDDSIAARVLRGDRGGAQKLLEAKTPPSREKPEDPEKGYVGALRRSNEIQADIARIDNVLNDPNAKDGETVTDENGNKKYVDRKALATQRAGLVKEQKIHLTKTAGHELNSTLPASKHNGRTVTDKATGARFRSDGKQWIPITE